MRAFDQETTQDSGDLLAGVRDPRSEPAGIRVAPNSWMRVDDGGRAAVIVLSGLLSTILALAVLVLFPGAGSSAESVAIALGLLSIAALFGAIAIRRYRAGLWVSPQGVCLRGFVRTHPLALAEVERFVPGCWKAQPAVSRAARMKSDLASV